jgi:hypothetical protein
MSELEDLIRDEDLEEDIVKHALSSIWNKLIEPRFQG